MAFPHNSDANYFADVQEKLKQFKSNCDKEESDVITNLLDDLIARFYDIRKRGELDVSLNVQVRFL